MGRVLILGGVGSSGSSPASPNSVTLGSPTIRFTNPDAQGKVYVQVFVPYTPPVFLSTFAGVIPYLQAPDNIPASASGNRATIGDNGFIIAADTAHASDAGSVVPVAQPVALAKVPYDASNLIIAIQWPAPTSIETWRLYALSYSADVTPQLVTADHASPTPNITFTVNPTSLTVLGASGSEFAPLAASFTSPDGNPTLTSGDGIAYSLGQVGGGQFYTISAVWTNATGDPRFSQLGSYNILIVDGSGNQQLAASPSPTDLQFTSSPPWVVPSSQQTFTLYLISLDINGNANTLIPGLTPSVTYMVGQQLGPLGIEYAALIEDMAGTLPGFQTNGAGQKDFPVIVTFLIPDDPNWAGAVFHFLYPAVTISSATDTNYTILTFASPHTVSPGGAVFISGFTGNWTPCNGSWPVTGVTTLTLEIPVDATLFGAMTGTPTGSPDITLTGVQPTSPVQLDVFQFPASNIFVTLYALSVGADGSVNTYVPGTTPNTGFYLTPPPSGGSGIEVLPVVTGFSASIVYGISGDGTETWSYSCSWTPLPLTTYPNYGGVKLVLRNLTVGGNPDVVLYAGPADVNFQSPTWPVGSAASFDLFAVTMDVNNKENTIFTGVTPTATFTVSLQTTGSVLGNRLKTSTLHHTLNVNAGLLGVAPGQVGTTEITDNSITTPKLTTSEISIGFAGSSMPIRFRVYNHAGSAIAWIGDDTANSGFVGAWFQQMYVGGSGPSGAPFQVNSSGQLSINLSSSNAGSVPISLNLNGVTTSIQNNFDSTLSDYVGLRVQNNSTSVECVISATGGRWVDGSGSTLIGLLTPGGTAGELTLNDPGSSGQIFIEPTGSGGSHITLSSNSGANVSTLSATGGLTMSLGSVITIGGNVGTTGSVALVTGVTGSGVGSVTFTTLQVIGGIVWVL